MVQSTIHNARAVCYHRQNDNICSIKKDKKSGEVTVVFPRQKIISSSWLFTQHEEILIPEDTNIQIMLIHEDFHKESREYDLTKIYQSPRQYYSMRLKPREWKLMYDEGGG